MTLDSLFHAIGPIWPTVVAILGVLVALAASAHIVLHKSDVRAAIGWTGLVWLSPFVGAVLYWLLGVNRIRRRAGRIRRAAALAHEDTEEIALKRKEAGVLPMPLVKRFSSLATAVGTTTAQELVAGNTVEPLLNGDEAYPAMIEAIASAKHTVGMSSYILDNDRSGNEFAQALAAAVKRGVTVRVLIDGVGARYSRPPMPRSTTARCATGSRSSSSGRASPGIPTSTSWSATARCISGVSSPRKERPRRCAWRPSGYPG